MARGNDTPLPEKHAFCGPFIRFETFCNGRPMQAAADYTPWAWVSAEKPGELAVDGALMAGGESVY